MLTKITPTLEQLLVEDPSTYRLSRPGFFNTYLTPFYLVITPEIPGKFFFIKRTFKNPFWNISHFVQTWVKYNLKYFLNRHLNGNW